MPLRMWSLVQISLHPLYLNHRQMSSSSHREKVFKVSTPSCRQVNMFRETVIAVIARRHTSFWLRLQILPSSHIASPILSRTSCVEMLGHRLLWRSVVSTMRQKMERSELCHNAVHSHLIAQTCSCGSDQFWSIRMKPGRGVTVTPVCSDPLIASQLYLTRLDCGLT